MGSRHAAGIANMAMSRALTGHPWNSVSRVTLRCVGTKEWALVSFSTALGTMAGSLTTLARSVSWAARCQNEEPNWKATVSRQSEHENASRPSVWWPTNFQEVKPPDP